jgi:hypothetical protein
MTLDAIESTFISLINNIKHYKMKKIIFFVSLMILSLSASTIYASEPGSKTDKTSVPNTTENKLSAEEIIRLSKRVEEIRKMDKTNLTHKEKRELRKELRVIKENVKRSGQVVYISAGTLVLILILVILLV